MVFDTTDGERAIATILKHDNKTTSYKIALLRAINDLVLAYPDLSAVPHGVAIPLRRIAELWIAYYWPFTDEIQPIYQGARSERQGVIRNDLSFRPALNRLRAEWQKVIKLSVLPSDGFFLVSDMRTPRRRATYDPTLQKAYDAAVTSIATAVQMPIRYAGPEQWSVFAKPARLFSLPASVTPLPGTASQEVCVVVAANLWAGFHRLSLYIEALSIHEWCLFTEGVAQRDEYSPSRGDIYSLLTARPDNRRPLSWERNEVDILLHEQVPFTCPWTRKPIRTSRDYDLDHLLPLAVYPVNELWNLLPVDKEFNQHLKRDRVPSSQRLQEAVPWLASAYHNYQQSAKLGRAVQEDAALRFTAVGANSSFAVDLAYRAVNFIDRVAVARYVQRF
ncbi:HNH endonuclease domain-containing protein [Solirubrum puertoriconensis]|uniref:HNH nuclease domain-containing protein n=1 Tax=Solirubrum puertoriconensis TaxID=1751427 RepID=A0A9X0HN64_SOLP1|nr:HNH endonuclease domain-containing protein [Solirubrum puertoriconensis]KUG09115.1 hypothetical protein ASU33_20065 [Solirubrum puertoriconensis]